MKIKPLIIALSGIALAGTICTSAFFSYAQTDSESTVQAEKVSVNDKGYYAENLPYYKTEENVEEVVVESSNINGNGTFYFLGD